MGGDPLLLNLPEAVAEELLAVVRVADVNAVSTALLGRTLPLATFEYDEIIYDADTVPDCILIRNTQGAPETSETAAEPMTIVTERQTEGERQIVRYVRGEEIENTSFIRDEQGNEYYIPAIRETAQDPDSPLMIWEMACEPNTDASHLTAWSTKTDSVMMRTGQAGLRFKLKHWRMPGKRAKLKSREQEE